MPEGLEPSFFEAKDNRWSLGCLQRLGVLVNLCVGQAPGFLFPCIRMHYSELSRFGILSPLAGATIPPDRPSHIPATPCSSLLSCFCNLGGVSSPVLSSFQFLVRPYAAVPFGLYACPIAIRKYTNRFPRLGRPESSTEQVYMPNKRKDLGRQGTMVKLEHVDVGLFSGRG